MLPEYVTPEDLAKHLGWSAREIRKKVREIGAFRILGNAMILLKEDVDALMEATRPPPALTPRRAADADITGGYQELLKLRAAAKAGRKVQRVQEK